MLFQILLNIIFFILKIALRFIGTLVLIPFGIYWLFLEFFTDFANEGSLWFYSVFAIANLVAYYFLWKPIMWIAGLSSIFEIGMD